MNDEIKSNKDGLFKKEEALDVRNISGSALKIYPIIMYDKIKIVI